MALGVWVLRKPVEFGISLLDQTSYISLVDSPFNLVQESTTQCVVTSKSWCRYVSSSRGWCHDAKNQVHDELPTQPKLLQRSPRWSSYDMYAMDHVSIRDLYVVFDIHHGRAYVLFQFQEHLVSFQWAACIPWISKHKGAAGCGMSLSNGAFYFDCKRSVFPKTSLSFVNGCFSSFIVWLLIRTCLQLNPANYHHTIKETRSVLRCCLVVPLFAAHLSDQEISYEVLYTSSSLTISEYGAYTAQEQDASGIPSSFQQAASNSTFLHREPLRSTEVIVYWEGVIPRHFTTGG